jgi:hypothetical protein
MHVPDKLPDHLKRSRHVLSIRAQSYRHGALKNSIDVKGPFQRRLQALADRADFRFVDANEEETEEESLVLDKKKSDLKAVHKTFADSRLL